MSEVRGLVAAVRERIPVDPDAPEARRWLLDELAKAPYVATRPTWFDRLSEAFLDWIDSLTVPTGDGIGDWIPVILTLAAAALLVAALLIFGLPRLNRRSRLTAELFGQDDRRSSDDMRRAAAAAASAADWSLASEEMFRALARRLAERTVLVLTPGTTAHGFAVRAAGAFPAEETRLAQAARTFDQVRYLGAPGTEQDFRALARLEQDLRDAKPVQLDPPTRSLVS